jgi:hypothetical protein
LLGFIEEFIGDLLTYRVIRSLLATVFGLEYSASALRNPSFTMNFRRIFMQIEQIPMSIFKSNKLRITRFDLKGQLTHANGTVLPLVDAVGLTFFCKKEVVVRAFDF